jgi:alpha-tubulin suppressor-like RCC1 family protein
MRDRCWMTRPRLLATPVVVALLATVAAAPAAHAQAAPFVLESISAGTDHACGITPQHVAYCWGRNADGELGNPAVTTPCPGTGEACSPKPVRVAAAVPFAFISAGHAFTCALTTSGVAYCWGNNTYGQLGIGSQVASHRPAKVAIEDVTFQSISAGDTHACAVTSAGAAYCWGRNAGGQLGTGRTGGGHTAPAAVSGHLAFRTISAGYYHTCGVTRDGKGYCWGRNDQGELGNAPRAASGVPVRVAGEAAFRLVEAAAQFDYSCAVDANGALSCWGANCFNQLGVDSLTEQCGTPPMPCSTKPSAVHAAGTFQTVGVAFSHSCALMPAGAVLCWGDNNAGQLGNGNSGDRSVTPVAVAGGQTYRTLSVGREFTCAITAQGVPQCWGTNDKGQLGIGAGGNRAVPTPLAEP